MTDLVRINNSNGVGLPVTLADGSRWIIPAFVQITAAGALVGPGGGTSGDSLGTELDTDGNIVPTYKGHAYTYDENGNLETDTVIDGSNRWIKSYGAYAPGGPTADSGWVKQ